MISATAGRSGSPRVGTARILSRTKELRSQSLTARIKMPGGLPACYSHERRGELIDDVGGLHGFAVFWKNIYPELEGLDLDENEDRKQEKKNILIRAKARAGIRIIRQI